eukprot:CAMPEP_0117590068 /NCGR_PEP_ID=MMETSP0784-20121206/70770_1 /TAXON_ID=39447 /ORGANISM="" /LENGTH=702 /DNA_ID=CAMNT_0005391635 /DNA_START=38 /DNA_END=2146 /DNA_ORIENTATION=-
MTVVMCRGTHFHRVSVMLLVAGALATSASSEASVQEVSDEECSMLQSEAGGPRHALRGDAFTEINLERIMSEGGAARGHTATARGTSDPSQDYKSFVMPPVIKKHWYQRKRSTSRGARATTALPDGSKVATHLRPTPRKEYATRSSKPAYEVWASDQSNSEPGQAGLGVKGGLIWIWDSASIEGRLENRRDVAPLSCSPRKAVGPCNMLDIFPSTLQEYNADGSPTGSTLGDLDGFGMLHGMYEDPGNRYVNANMFAPGGGYIGIIDTRTKEAVGLFRVTKVGLGGDEARSVHMSFWTADGSGIIIANLAGKTVERINVHRDRDGTIKALSFDRSASVGLGQAMSVVAEATVFGGKNAFGHALIGDIIGSYRHADFGDLTPNDVCKENGCAGADGTAGGRANNVVICPIISSRDNGYITLAGGGLFVLDLKATPMSIVGEYGQAVIYGASCAGVQVDDQVFVDSGVLASSAGADQSMFAVYSLDDTQYEHGPNPENIPMPTRVFQDDGNTLSNGNVEGDKATDTTGQKPGVTTRRDAHGAWHTIDGKYLHVVDRIQNVVEVFDVATYERSTYDLVSADGKSGRQGAAAPCFARSVLDDASLPLNDPAPDLLDITPDGEYFMVALRGPAPVSVPHAAQGSCPGVGVVKITEGGRSGRLIDVLRTTNTVDDATVLGVPGGVNYTGAERSDVHGVIVVSHASSFH